MANPEAPRGDILMEWDFPEFVQHERGRLWYIGFVVFSVLLLIYSFFSKSYTFAAVMILSGLILVVRMRRTPPDVHVALREEGLEVGRSFYPWKEIKEFWILYEPPTVKMVYFHFKTTLRPALDISLEKENPLKVRQYLSQFLTENTELEDEPAAGQIGRFLKL